MLDISSKPKDLPEIALAESTKTSSKTLTQMDLDSLWHPMVQHKKYDRSPPKRIDKAQGYYVTDSEGKEYLDRISGLLRLH